MIATIGEARVRATTFISTAHPRDISSSSSSSFVVLFSPPDVNVVRATLEQGIVMAGIREIVWGGPVEALRGQNACDFQHRTRFDAFELH